MPLGGADDAKVDSWWLFETWIFFLCIYSVKGGDDYLITSWANAKGDAKADQQSRDKQSTFLIPSFFLSLGGEKYEQRGQHMFGWCIYTYLSKCSCLQKRCLVPAKNQRCYRRGVNATNRFFS